MANNVFANGREISCKKADGKTICAFPDVCMTPPTSPATPTGVPVPYPNTGMAKDTTNGSRTVKISGNEIIKKDVSYYKTSYGDEAGCATPAQKGIITGTIQGKVYFTSWSMDVKVEGKNAVRHLDTTTHNHGSNTNEVIPWPFLDTAKIVEGCPCKEEKQNIKDECSLPVKMEVVCAKNDRASKKCLRAVTCRLVSYNQGKAGMCCKGQTPDHLIEASGFGGSRKVVEYPTWTYYPNRAPCICASGHASKVTTHGVLSTKRKALILLFRNTFKTKEMTVNQAAIIGASTASHTFKNCSEECIKAQLLDFHKDENQKITPPAYGSSLSSTKAGKKGMGKHAQKLAIKLINLL